MIFIRDQCSRFKRIDTADFACYGIGSFIHIPGGNMLRHPIVALEEALCSYEDLYLLFQYVALATGTRSEHLDASLKHFSSEFRTWLLGVRPGSRFDKRFLHSEWLKGRTSLPNTLAVEFLGRALFGWVRDSRRVYHVAGDLSELLGHTSLHDLTWQEIQWPFESFAITLQQPIVLPDSQYGTKWVDCIVLYHNDELNRKELYCTSTQTQTAPRLKRKDRDRLRRLFEKRKMHSLRNEAIRHMERIDKAQARRDVMLAVPGAHVFVDDTVLAVKRIVAAEGNLVQDRTDHYAQVYQLVAGLAQYLVLRPAKVQAPPDSEGTQGGALDPTAVVNGADIATVVNSYRLSPEESQWLAMDRKKRGEVPAHWRRGFWRRRSGEGDNPSAEKVVWVRPTLVRADRLPEGGLPGGTRMLVTLKKA